VNIEIAVTKRLGRRIFPVLIRGTHDEAIPISLETMQYIDARQEYQQAIENRLVLSVTRYFGVTAGVENGQEVEISPVEMPVDESGGGDEGVVEPDSTRVRGQRRVVEQPNSRWFLGKLDRTKVIVVVGIVIVVIVAIFGYRGVVVPRQEAEASATAQARVIAEASATEFAGIPFVYVLEGEFRIMQTEVTNEMYQRFMDAGGYSEENRSVYWSDEGGQWRAENAITEPSLWDNSGFNRDKQPVVGVSWYEAEAFANWLGEESGRPMRLPTDAEWQLACQGTDGREYPWGDVPAPSKTLLNYNNNVGSTTAVGIYPDGVSPYGVLDMGATFGS
jgi:hypothetical protein